MHEGLMLADGMPGALLVLSSKHQEALGDGSVTIPTDS